MSNLLSFEIGNIVNYGKSQYKITRIIDTNYVLGYHIKNGHYQKLQVDQISLDDNPNLNVDDNDILAYTDKQWTEAKKRFDIIQPIIRNPKNTELVIEAAEKAGVHQATIYRWISRYRSNNKISSLVSKEGRGAKGKPRLSPEIEAIIQSNVIEHYLKKRQKSIQHVIIQIEIDCQKAKLPSPDPSTIRRRIARINAYDTTKFRMGKKRADELYGPKTGVFPGGNFPLEHVQIDHTLVDIILVDESDRQPVGRPWITVAIDVYSRMVMGFYLSFDPPGSIGTGLCIAHSILPKTNWLTQFDIDEEWPCWGVMNTIHVDNAREFKGNMLKKACNQYGINLEYRPVKKPNYGGHVERLLGTSLKEIHNLPGSTLSSIEKRKYKSPEKEAALTLKELEHWLIVFFTCIYHKRIHSGIGSTPLAKFKKGLLGDKDNPGIGLPSRILDEYRLKLDFMPYYERTVQNDGVVIDHIHYYHDSLRPYINSAEKIDGKRWQKTKHIFRRDPRNIKYLYFWNPDLKEYQQIPYRNISYPAMSIWEYRKALKHTKVAAEKEVNEQAIFKAYDELNKIEEKATSSKKSVRRRKARRKNTDNIKEKKKVTKKKENTIMLDFNPEEIEPFDILEESNSL